MIDFTGGTSFPANEVNEAGGDHVLVLRSGEILKGTLTDVGGTSPLRISFSTGGSVRDFTSNDVARIYFAKPSVRRRIDNWRHVDRWARAGHRPRARQSARPAG